MEYTKTSNIMWLIDDLSHDISLSGYTDPENVYKEIETLIFLAAKTKYNNMPLVIEDEQSIRNYFKSTKELNGISIETIIQNIVVFNGKVKELFSQLCDLDDKKLAETFDYLEEQKKQKLGKFAVEDTTTKRVSNLMLSFCKDLKGKSIIDICSGSGTILTEAGEQGCSKLTGYEININTAELSKMRTAIHNLDAEIRICDVLQESLSEKYDIAVTEPPFALRTFKATVKDEDESLQYSDSDRVIKADWHFILKALNSTKENGVTIALVGTGALFNTPDTFYRKQIVEGKRLQSVVMLPTGIIPGTSVSTCLMVFSRNNENIEFINASECYIKTKGYNRLLDLKAIDKLVNEKPEEKVISINVDGISKENYSLDVNKYLGVGLCNQINNPALIKDYAEVIPGFQYTTKNVNELEPGEGSINVVKIINIINGAIDYDSLVSIEPEEKKIDKYILKENDILVSTKGTAIKLALVDNLEDRKVVPHSNLTVIRCKDGLEPLYLISFLKSETGTALFKSIQTGSIIMNITQKSIENFSFPMVDDDTQKVISNRYKAITKKLIEIKEELARIEEKLETLWEDGVSE